MPYCPWLHVSQCVRLRISALGVGLRKDTHHVPYAPSLIEDIPKDNGFVPSDVNPYRKALGAYR